MQGGKQQRRRRLITELLEPRTVLATFNGSEYTLTSTTSTWEQAEALAQSLGGHLVAINSQAEQNFIRATFGDIFAHIGLTDRDDEGVFKWTTGESITYSNWGPNEPNNAGSGEDFGQLRADGTWNDLSPDRLHRAIIEVPLTAPRAEAALRDVIIQSGNKYVFDVTYLDDSAVDIATLGNGDIRITGPNGYSQTATLVRLDDDVNASKRVATYEVVAPGNGWDRADDGLYTVSLVAGQVADTSGNTSPAATLGSYRVSLDRPRGGDAYSAIYNNRVYVLTDQFLTWSNAQASAQSIGGHLVSINDASEQAFVAETFTSVGGSFYIGINDATTEGTFAWANGDAVTYTNWAPGEPNNFLNEDFGVLYPNGKWNDFAAPLEERGIIEVPRNAQYYNGSWYLLTSAAKSWTDAQAEAERLGGYLTAVDDASEQAWLEDHFDPGASGMWLGQFRDASNNRVWSSGQSISYTNWASGQPANNPYTCIGSDGRWATAGTNKSILGIIEIPLAATVSLFGGHEYRQTAPTSWAQANADAAVVTANLTAITSAAEQSYVATTFPGIFAHIGINDAQTEGTYRWSSGETVSYTNWGTNEPNNAGTGEDAGQIRPDGTWNDLSADRLHPAIVEYDHRRPTATATLGAVTAGGATYTFTVTYTDEYLMHTATFGNNDIRVTGPNGFAQNASFVSVNNAANAPSRTATYRISAPGGAWEKADDGTYTVSVLRRSVTDTRGNAVPAGAIGSFNVSLNNPGTLRMEATAATVTEGATTVEFAVIRDGGTAGTVTVDYTTVDGSAVQNRDYLARSGTISLADGVVRGSVQITILNDYDRESDESFGFSIDRVGGGASLGAPRTAVGTIRDDGDPAVGTGNGLRAEYFDTINLTGTSLVRVDPTVNFLWANGSPDPSIQPDTFSARWTGWIEPLYNEDYTFEARTDDGVRLWVDGRQLIDSWVDRSATSSFGAIRLEAGRRYPIRMEYFENSGGASAELFWQSNSQTRQIIPQIRLYDGSSGPATVSFATARTLVNESAGTVTIELIRSGQLSSAVSVQYATSNLTAISGIDYSASTGTISFAANQTTRPLVLNITGDTSPERNERFALTLSNPSGGQLGPQSTMEVEIVDDDPGAYNTETVYSGLSLPTAIDFAASNRVFIAQQDGIVRVAQNGSLLTTPFIDIRSEVNGVRDRGLLGLAVHPNFPTQPYVYLLYTYDPPQTVGRTGLDGPDQIGNRVARMIRVEADSAANYNRAKANSAVVILGTNSTWANISRPDLDSTGDTSIPPSCGSGGTLRDCIATDSQSHTIGQVRFGTDGMLYVSVGDGTSYGRVDPRTTRVQDLNSLSGKLLRIDPITGQAPSDNPFYSGDANANVSKVYSYGLRNPFRFEIQPSTGAPYIGDVGWTQWEELNTGRGANFGWPYYEGGNGVNLRTGGYDTLPEAIAFYGSGQTATSAVWARPHSDGAEAIIMGDFYTGSSLPSLYRDGLFVTDVNQGIVDVLYLDANGRVDSSKRFANGVSGIVQMQTGPDGAMYFVNIGAGTIGRWTGSGGGEGTNYSSDLSALDVNLDGDITPIDALVVINLLNGKQHGPDDPSIAPDVTRDGVVTPHDALIVINYLNRRSRSGGEGEAVASPVASMRAKNSPSAGSIPSLAPNLIDLALSDWNQPRSRRRR
jgi:glucose/arabinose dehydrogenase